MTQNGCALQYSHDDLKSDPSIVKAAVTQNGCALQYAHDDLKGDPDVVKAH